MVTSTVIGGPHHGRPFMPVAQITAAVQNTRQEAVEEAQRRKEAHAEQMRTLGRKLDQEARENRRAARKVYFQQVDEAYAERRDMLRREREQFLQRIGKKGRVLA